MNKKGINLEEIIAMYNMGHPPTVIAEHFGCCKANVSRRLKKAGIQVIRDYSKGRYQRTNRYKIDENYFDFIDSEDKAYFLGLMYSDGSVSKNQFYLKLIDLDIIEKFKKCLKAETPIRTIYPANENWNTCYILEISSQKLCNALVNKGCVINKTRVIRLPELRPDLYRHFIRGYFDGDGCLQLQDKIYHCRFDLTSASKEFLEDIRPLITENAKTNGYLGKESKYEVWHLNYSGHQVKQILDWLYNDSKYYLLRKYTKYKLLSSL